MAFKSGKLFLGFLVYSLTIAVIITLAGIFWLDHEFKKPGPLSAPILFEVPRGASSGGIAELLSYEGAIHDMYIFKYAARVTGAQSDLKAGEYELQPGMSARDILSLLREGKTFQRQFTIPEGLTSYEILNLIMQVEDLKPVLIEPLVEGSLLPETYSYSRGETWADIVRRMENAMQNTIKELWPKRVENLPFSTPEEAMVLASIVEKETGVSEERKRVAGVFINRLKRGIALQTDPTVIYAITKGEHKNDGKGPLGRRLLTKDLKIDSPYNTYKYPGLPPGPIANPGRASIEAVLDPEEHDFIYFVANGTGGHIFAKTLEEHNRNVAQWRKIRRRK